MWCKRCDIVFYNNFRLIGCDVFEIDVVCVKCELNFILNVKFYFYVVKDCVNIKKENFSDFCFLKKFEVGVFKVWNGCYFFWEGFWLIC